MRPGSRASSRRLSGVAVDFVIVLAILAIVVLVISAPIRRARADGAEGDSASDGASAIAELEAARDAKYREIRDAELDRRTGKLSDADYQSIDRELRAEAIEILRALDRAGR
jgi:Na+-transporting methylmalonyl-CoA/oxaloacetate decarboxylase gamma subunit